MSSTWALWVSQPAEMRSTPAAAMAGAVAGVMRPEASAMARPSMRRTASASISGPMLSSNTASGPSLQRLVELVERIDLDFDLDQMADAGTRGADRGRHAAGRGDIGSRGVDFYLPFGGEKDSSFGGREQGKAAQEFYTSIHTVTVAAP